MAWYRSLEFSQKVYVGLLLVGVALLIPRLVLVGFVGVERVLVAGIMSAEAAILGVFERVGLVAAGVAAVLVAGWGVWIFIRPSKFK